MTGAGRCAPASAPWRNWPASFASLSEGEYARRGPPQGFAAGGITPYYASLMGLTDASEPLRRTHITTGGEYVRAPGEDDDPLSEDHDTVVPGLVHRLSRPEVAFPGFTGTCSTYCRYCTRSAWWAIRAANINSPRASGTRPSTISKPIPRVRDVLLSGAIPLTLSGRQAGLAAGAGCVPSAISISCVSAPECRWSPPQRVTRSLTRVLKKHRPWMSLHFTHPRELTKEVAESTARLADAGLPLGSQTVLLKDVNDTPETAGPT